MTKLLRQSLVAYGTPLCETIVDCPKPRGSEVLVRVERCGVCHSDLHVQDGYFKLGGDKKLDISAGRTLPFTLGHEIAGVVEEAGPDAAIARGRRVAVFPWIGCGACPAYRRGEENLCAASRHLGIAVDGGYATHVVVPHPRYLLDYGPLSPALAGALMCSGLTAYAALKRQASRAARGPVLLVGLGGVGMMGLALARAMYATAPLVDQLVPRYGIHPGRQQFSGVIGVALDVDRNQRLLHEILRLRCASPDAREPAFVIGPQVPAQPVEQCPMRRRVAVKAGYHQRPEYSFVRGHLTLRFEIRKGGVSGYNGACR
jgi:Alcohol dehydrogenase GroES-like domain